MGFAAGFSAGYGAVTNGFATGLKYSQQKAEQKKAEDIAAAKLATEQKKSYVNLNKYINDEIKIANDYLVSASDSDITLDEFNANVSSANDKKQGLVNYFTEGEFTPMQQGLIGKTDLSMNDTYAEIDIIDKVTGKPTTVALPSSFNTEDNKTLTLLPTGTVGKVDNEGRIVDTGIKPKKFASPSLEKTSKGQGFFYVDNAVKYITNANAVKLQEDGHDIRPVPTLTNEDKFAENYMAQHKGATREEAVGAYKNAKEKYQATVALEAVQYAKSVAETTYDPIKAEEMELKVKMGYLHDTKMQDRTDEFDKMTVLEKSSDDLYNEFEADVASGAYKSGLVHTAKAKLAEYGGFKFAELEGLSSEELQAKLKIDTKTGDMVAKYVKLISGAAATDAERATLANIIFGSEYKDEQAKLIKFKSFMAKMKNDNMREAQYLMKRGYAKTAGDYLYGSKKPVEKPVEKTVQYGDDELETLRNKYRK